MSRITRAAWQWKFPAHVLVIIVLTASLFHHPASGLSTTNTYLVLVGHSNLPSTRRGASPLLMTKKKEDDDMNVLSDLDARVLQSMLREKNVLDLQQEVNMKKLLERAVRPKSTTTTTTDLPKSNKDNGPYSSELFKVCVYRVSVNTTYYLLIMIHPHKTSTFYFIIYIYIYIYTICYIDTLGYKIMEITSSQGR